MRIRAVVTMRLEAADIEAIKSLVEAFTLVGDARQDMPWREDLDEVTRLLGLVVDRLKLKADA
jgi:hypothetical protein